METTIVTSDADVTVQSQTWKCLQTFSKWPKQQSAVLEINKVTQNLYKAIFLVLA